MPTSSDDLVKRSQALRAEARELIAKCLASRAQLARTLIYSHDLIEDLKQVHEESFPLVDLHPPTRR